MLALQMFGQNLGQALARAVSGNCEFHDCLPSEFRAAPCEDVEVTVDLPRGAPDEQSVDVRTRNQFLAIVCVDRTAVEAGNSTTEHVPRDRNDLGLPGVGIV